MEDKTLVRKATGLAKRKLFTRQSQLGNKEVVEHSRKRAVHVKVFRRLEASK